MTRIQKLLAMGLMAPATKQVRRARMEQAILRNQRKILHS
jgi:hypothetical protein